MKGKNIFFSTILLISAITILGYALIYKPITSPTPTYDVVRDTVIYKDTITYYKPVPRDSLIVRYRTATLPVANKVSKDDNDDSLLSQPAEQDGGDSAAVVVPITQKVYEDSTYKAWVSGYEPQLDSIFVYQKTQVINHYIREKPKYWGIGLQIGYGCTGKELRPYVGIGVNYNIFRW
nr:hypothetical protein [uncultured Prevotella sp.]